MKGLGFNSLVTEMKKSFSKPVWDRIIEDAPPQSRALITAPPLATDWIDIEIINALAATAIRIGFEGNATRWSEISHRQVSRDLGGIYRVFIKLLSPGFVVSRASLIWTQYFRDNGVMRAELGNNEVNVFLEGAASVPPWILNGHCGSVRAALEATRIRDIAVRIVESDRASAHWHASWRK